MDIPPVGVVLGEIVVVIRGGEACGGADLISTAGLISSISIIEVIFFSFSFSFSFFTSWRAGYSVVRF